MTDDQAAGGGASGSEAPAPDVEQLKEDPRWQSLNTEIRRLEGELQALRVQVSGRSPELTALQEQLEAAQASLAAMEERLTAQLTAQSATLRAEFSQSSPSKRKAITAPLDLEEEEEEEPPPADPPPARPTRASRIGWIR
jgi:chromosome segregation ATPase